MILIFFLFLFASFFLAIKNPTYFICFYLIASTKFLGFLDIENLFVFGGLGLGFPALNALTFMSAFVGKVSYKIPRVYVIFIFFIGSLITYGVFYPFLLGYQSIAKGVISSKDFWSLAILIYAVMHRKSIDIYKIIKTIQIIGLYLSLAYVVYLIGNYGPPFYLEENGIRGYFPTYMSLAIFLFYMQFQKHELNAAKFIVIIMFLFLGIVLAGHFSLFVGTITSLIYINVFYKNSKFNFVRIIYRTFFLLSIIFVVFISSSTIRDVTENKVSQILYGTDVALISRDSYNRFRWDAIQERPLFGYGFIHKDSPVTSEYKIIENNRFAEKFSVIDSGYVDLLIKFGFIGAVLYLFLWVWLVSPILLHPKKHNVMQLSMASYLVQYFLINYTWSVFSYAHGLIPAFVALYIIYSHRKSGMT